MHTLEEYLLDLKSGLENDNLSTQKVAIHAIRDLNDPKAVDPPMAILKDYNIASYLRNEITDIIGMFDITPLIKMLYEQNVPYNHKLEIIRTLGTVPTDQRAIETLVYCLKDLALNPMAALFLKELGWQSGNNIDYVYFLFGNHRFDEILKIGDKAVDPLINLLVSLEKYLDDEQPRYFGLDYSHICELLGKIGDKKAIVPVSRLLYKEFNVYAPDALVKLGAVSSLLLTHNSEITSQAQIVLKRTN